MDYCHDFRQKLAFSLGERERFDISHISKAISKCKEVKKTDAELDRAGVDYIATLEDGARIGIDAKAREKGASRYWKHGEPELALEIWSVCGIKKGWTLSTRSNVDMILYTFDKADCNKFYLLPFQQLRMAFERNGKQWCEKYSRKKQQSNKGAWQSEAVFVPASVVIKAVSDTFTGAA